MMEKFSRDLIIITLQMIIIKNALRNGWGVRKLNQKQIEITKKWCRTDNYERICLNLLKTY